jgi:hypothetical protein
MDGVTRKSFETPDKFGCDLCRFAQSNGECPGASRTFLREFGMADVEATGRSIDLEAMGLRFGKGPVDGTRREVARAGRGGGAMRPGGLLGAGARESGRIWFWASSVFRSGMVGADAVLCAEFRAGNCGGGRLSSSSLLSSWSKENVGTTVVPF